jgi:hypothetical protein
MTLYLVAALVVGAAIEPSNADESDPTALRTLVAAALDRDGSPGGIEKPAAASPAVSRWLTVHGNSLDTARSTSILPAQPWGLVGQPTGAAAAPGTLHLFVFDWHASGRLVVYGLVGGYGKAYLFGDPAKVALAAVRVGRSTVFTVPKRPPDPLGTVVVVELLEKVETRSLAVRPSEDGRVLLHARDAVVHGRTLRFEPEAHKDTLGYWTDPGDHATWHFEVDKPGEYAVEILQGCGKGSGGSVVGFEAAGQVLKVTVEDTGGFQKFVARGIGRFRFDKPGEYALHVRPVSKPGVAVMDLRQVTLTRAAE